MHIKFYEYIFKHTPRNFFNQDTRCQGLSHWVSPVAVLM